MTTVGFIVESKRWFYRLLISACAVAMVVIFVTTLVQIFMRRVLHSPLVWAEDLTVFLFVWVTFLGAAVLFERKILISIDTVVALLPDRAQKVCQAASNIIILISLGYLLHLSWEFMLRQRALDHNLGGALSVPSWIIMIPVIIAVGGMVWSILGSFLAWIDHRDDVA